MDVNRSGNTMLHIRGGMIEEIGRERGDSLVTVSYTDCVGCESRGQREQKVRLVVGRDTLIMDEKGRRVSVRELGVGMVINASISAAMTRSIPPQSVAYRIRIVARPASDVVTIGRMIDIDRRNRSFTLVSDGNRASVIRFHVAEDALVQDMFGRPMAFSALIPGLRVRVVHAAFMTASIPPQTTAFEIRVIR